MSNLDLDMLNALSGESLAPEQAAFLERTHSHALCSLQLELHWNSEHVTHVDCQYLPRVNLWREFFPEGMDQALMDKPTGHVDTLVYAAGELVPGWQGNQLVKPRAKAFNHHFSNSGYIEPRVGRFYPRAVLAGSHGLYSDDFRPLRIVAVDELEIDLNHPLATNDLAITLQIGDIWAAKGETGGSCQDVAELLIGDGPGMQARWQHQETDFWSDTPFSRAVPEADAAYYQLAKTEPHLDTVACAQITELLASLLRDGTKVLDLMAGAYSHIPESLANLEVTGLGMNQQELDANTVLEDRVIHDLNAEPVLPFESAQFDAVICTDAIEYLIKPLAVLEQVNRVLKPGGVFIVQFSNRPDSVKTVKLWTDLHEFERLGLVLEYFLKTDSFTDFHSRSMRGLLRPEDDKTAPRLLNSDPVYSVWGFKV